MGGCYMIYDDLALNNGAIFKEAADILCAQMQLAILSIQFQNGQQNDQTNLRAALFVPAIVNRAFACELFLKAMLSKNTRSHKLQDLFDALEIDIQNKIQSNTIGKMQEISKTYSDVEFRNDLITNGNIFAEWRYFHEGNVNSVNFAFISNFTKATLDIAIEERNKT